MSPADLRTVNHIPGGMLVKAGSTLLVHRKGALDNDVQEHTAENAHLSLAPEVVLRRVQVQARKGDTLASLGARHGVSAASLAAWNRLTPVALLKPGQRLVVLVPSAPARQAAKAPRSPVGSTKKVANTRPRPQKAR